MPIWGFGLTFLLDNYDNDDASWQQLQIIIIIIIRANKNATSIYATSVNYISAGLDDMQLSRAEV